jgi:hypothetical protein
MAELASSFPLLYERKRQLWRKADAASIKNHLFREGIMKMDNAIIVCEKIKIGRGKTIKKCNFVDKELEL